MILSCGRSIRLPHFLKADPLIGAGRIGFHDDDVGEVFCVYGCGAVVKVGGPAIKNVCETYEKDFFCDIPGLVMVCHDSTRK